MDVTSYLLGKNASSGGGGADEYFESTQSGNFGNAFTFGARFLKTIPKVEITKPNFNYAFYNYENLITIPQLDTSAVIMMSFAFQGCTSLVSVPLLNTSNVTSFSNTFNGCTSLTTVPAFDASKVTNFDNMFNNCRQLTDESLNNILKMCISATSYAGVKSLGALAMSGNYSAAKIQSLPSYQDFVNAGWTIGW